MTLQDIVRDETFEKADALSLADAKLKDFVSEQAAIEDRIKRASTEITRFRAVERERKQRATEAEGRLSEIQLMLDEIDRKRAEVLERWTEKREEKEQAEIHLRAARTEIDRSEANYRKDIEERDKGTAQLNALELDKRLRENQLRDAYCRATRTYYVQLVKRVDQAFASDEERSRKQIAAEAFKKARHEDPLIGDLCDQRDQFKELIRLATVPAVTETLRRELEKVEHELERRYPGALSIEERVSPAMHVEELFYLTKHDGTVLIFLPVEESTWNAIEDNDMCVHTTCAMRVLWEVIRGLGIRSADGKFRLEAGHCVFEASSLNADDINDKSLLIKLSSSATLTFRLSPYPAQIQEALLHEADNG